MRDNAVLVTAMFSRTVPLHATIDDPPDMRGMAIASAGAQPLRTPRIVKRIDTMETQAPDLALYFSAATAGVEKSKRDEDVAADEAELEQLADRVSAARSIY